MEIFRQDFSEFKPLNGLFQCLKRIVVELSVLAFFNLIVPVVHQVVVHQGPVLKVLLSYSMLRLLFIWLMVAYVLQCMYL